MIQTRLVRVTTASLLIGLLLTSCSKKPSKKPDALYLRGGGTSYPAVLYDEWFEKFNDMRDDIEVTYESVGSGKGVELFTLERVDFGASDNGMTDDEVKKAKRGVIQIPTAGTAVVLAYNLPDVKKLILSRDVYAAIFLGDIESWDDEAIRKLNPDEKLPKREIIPVVRLDSSGTTFLFTNHLAAVNSAWRDKHGDKGKRKLKWPRSALEEDGNEAVGGKVRVTEGSIGYVDIGTAFKAKLQAARLINNAGEVIEPKPLHATLALQGVTAPVGKPVFIPDPPRQDAYPISGFTYVMLHENYEDSKKARAIKQLMEWCLTEGQNECERLGYVRLGPETAAEALRAVRAIKE